MGEFSRQAESLMTLNTGEASACGVYWIIPRIATVLQIEHSRSSFIKKNH